MILLLKVNVIVAAAAAVVAVAAMGAECARVALLTRTSGGAHWVVVQNGRSV